MKKELPSELKDKCNMIIHGAAVACGGTSVASAQIPLADTAVITPIQIGMIVALGHIFDIEVTKTAARAIISGAGASLIGRGISQVVFGWIPGLGNVLNATTSVALTEAIGWMAVDQFASEYAAAGKDFSDIDVDDIEVPNDFEDAGNGAQDDVSTENDEEKSLTELMDEFFEGKKSKADNKDEYLDLLARIENELEGREERDPLYEAYRRFIRL